MNAGPDIESRLERLETALGKIDARLAKLEHRRPSEGQATLPVHEASVPATEGSVLAVAGFCSLILGGAFVLRALTESHVLPEIAGAILGLVYAAFWIWRANRYYAITAAVIAFPLIWETTMRFHIITEPVAGILVGAFGLFFLFVAIRTDQQVLAWVGSITAIIAAFAVGPSVVTLLAISAIGAATAFFASRWEFAAWPAALATNILALILLVTRPPGTTIALIGYAALWTVLPVQSSIAALIGGGGATFLMLPNLMALALAWAVIGVAAAGIARRTSARTIGVQSIVWIVAATVLTPYAGVAALIAYFLLQWREERLVLLAVVSYSVFMGINSIVSAPLIHTIILASFASLLALIPIWETRILARVVLVAGGLQILIEDLRLGSAAMLVIAFALYGAALIVVSRFGGRDVRKSGSKTATSS